MSNEINDSLTIRRRESLRRSICAAYRFCIAARSCTWHFGHPTQHGSSAPETRTVPLESHTEPTPPLLSLTEDVADKLRDLIVRGELEPGQHLVERRLCAQLEVSRTPMREALKLLKQDGLVEIFRNRGARVTPYTADDAVNLFEVLSALEGQAAARAAARISADELSDLQFKHDEMARHHAEENLDPYFALNTQIHDAVVRIADNPFIVTSRRRLMLLARRGRYMAIFNRDRWGQSLSEHEDLMTFLEKGNGDAAKAVWEKHLLNTGLSVKLALAAENGA